MRFFLIPSIIFLVVAIITDVVIARRLIRWRCFTGRISFLAHILLSVLALGFMAYMLTMPKGLGFTTMIYALFAIIGFYVCKWVYSLTHGIIGFVGLIRRKRVRSIERWSALAGFITMGVLAWSSLVTPNNLCINREEIVTSRLPKQFDGYKIVQISDIHLGTFAGDTSLISKTVAAINAEKPDLICFTGDLVNALSTETDGYTSILHRLHARDGVVSILGNHDYGDYYRWPSRAERDKNLQQLCDIEQSMGWTMLRNAEMTINRGAEQICIIGVENWGGRHFATYADLRKAHNGLRDKQFKILLSHNPEHWKQQVIPETNIDLMLAGHTHAMQCTVGFGKWKISPSKLIYKQWGGLYSNGNQHLYVNIGLGEVGVPLRIGANPEITVITLKHGK